mmetsp:Transcript_1156/g.4072  ORF Transcript_1156/g.4072 Transcript_1156/m.4072 type:complete len:214 (-) Transcript_1156:714-1355(-)
MLRTRIRPILDQCATLKVERRESRTEMSWPAMLCPTSTSGSSWCSRAIRKLSNPRSLPTTSSRTLSFWIVRVRSHGHALSSLRTTEKEERAVGLEVAPSAATPRCEMTDASAISGWFLALRMVCTCTAATMSGGAGGESRRTVMPFLPSGSATSYLVHEAEEVAAATPLRVSQHGPAMRRLRSSSSRHEVRAPKTREKVSPTASAGRAGYSPE